MTLDELLAFVSSGGGAAVRIDSRRVQPGDVFVAIQGPNCDGHDFIGQAVAGGAKYIVCERSRALPALHGPTDHKPATSPALDGRSPGGSLKASGLGDGSSVPGQDHRQAGLGDATPSCPDRGVVFIPVDNPALAAGRLAQAAHGDPGAQLTNLAVTGTNGKTTITFLVRACVEAAAGKCGLIGTVVCDTGASVTSSSLTTPDCLTIADAQRQMVDTGAEYMVIEASSHALSQDRLAGIDFKAAAFTNLTGDHLDYHKTKENYLAAKTRLFADLTPQATAVLNQQVPESQSIAQATKARVCWYAVDEPADLSAHIESMTIEGTTFVLDYRGRKERVKTPLLGRYNVANHLAAAGLCLGAGLDLATVAAGLSSLKGVPGRLEKVANDGEFAVLVDYAHTDDALQNVLTTLKPLCKGRLIVLFGCGGDRDKTKRPRMAAVVEQLADVVFVTSDNPRTEKPEAIIADIMVGLRDLSSERLTVEPDRRKAIELAIATARPDDILVLAGKGHETYQIIGDKKFDFSDRQVAISALRNRGSLTP